MTPIVCKCNETRRSELNKLYLKFFSLNLWPLSQWTRKHYLLMAGILQHKRPFANFRTCHNLLPTRHCRLRACSQANDEDEKFMQSILIQKLSWQISLSRKKCLNVPLKLKSFCFQLCNAVRSFPISGLSPRVHKTVKTSRHPRTAAFTSPRIVQQKNCGATSVNRLKAQLSKNEQKKISIHFFCRIRPSREI